MEQLVGDIVILRGLPGIGKTTLANLLAEGRESVILSADDFFLKNQEYSFKKEDMQQAYEWNFNRFKKEIEKQTKLIIVDNSNIECFHYWHYLDYGQRSNYRVSIMVIPHNDVSDRELSERSPHKVTKSVIYAMRKKWQWDLDKNRKS